ncbi:hypothetical protein A3E71_02305 [Candidatus Curtissbacteria bacterium RIFCSPHIGHO2_12_FULL_42_33]|nr:MAG: hypothetical protein A3E71_02305 [Candidatus Curtissbacteria bacterium RIFCSPHIGHO2_12_FULL_42_33]
MHKLIVRAGAAASTTALVLSSFIGPALAVDVVIEGNGSNSDNTANVAIQNDTTVTQTNYANITNDVDVDANTGKNDANDNTGGDVSINTGDASADVGVSNTANSNTAEVTGCCPEEINVTIKDNGTYSDNDANVAVQTKTTVDQDNTAYVKNDVDVDLDTGKNDANDNTGGDVSITTGNASADSVMISNVVNKNVASVSSGPNGGGSLSVWISGNGSNSDNTANVAVASAKTIQQTNYANISNDVDVDADTGKNDANDNTGGEVSIDTGDASADVWVGNLANFNAADIDACGCILDLSIKIKDNGTYSDNDANVALASLTLVDQDNTYECKPNYRGGWHKKCNDVDVDLDTGANDANDNTQDGEPEITTGDASGDVMVETTANSNVVGDADFDFDFPELPDFDGSSASLLLLLLALFS